MGSIRQFLTAFEQAAQALPAALPQPQRYTWVVGNAVERAFQPILKRLNQVENLTVEMAALNSDYWGQAITVTGLLTGHDLQQHLRDRDLGDGLLLPTIMLKPTDPGNPQNWLFLDDQRVESISDALQVPIMPVDGVDGLVKACLQSDSN